MRILLLIILIKLLYHNTELLKFFVQELKKFLNGVKLSVSNSNGIYKIYNNNIFIGVGVIENSLLKRDVIL